MYLACTSQSPPKYMACTWLEPRMYLALASFAGPFDVGSWMSDVGCSVFTISVLNTTHLPRLPRGGLGVLWYHPGTFLYP